jgi:hypothetical protein
VKARLQAVMSAHGEARNTMRRFGFEGHSQFINSYLERFESISTEESTKEEKRRAQIELAKNVASA